MGGHDRLKCALVVFKLNYTARLVPVLLYGAREHHRLLTVGVRALVYGRASPLTNCMYLCDGGAAGQLASEPLQGTTVMNLLFTCPAVPPPLPTIALSHIGAQLSVFSFQRAVKEEMEQEAVSRWSPINSTVGLRLTPSPITILSRHKMYASAAVCITQLVHTETRGTVLL